MRFSDKQWSGCLLNHYIQAIENEKCKICVQCTKENARNMARIAETKIRNPPMCIHSYIMEYIAHIHLHNQ